MDIDFRPPKSQQLTITMILSVLLNALKEFNFVGARLWRLSDGKDLVRVELTFHKTQPTSRYVKKRAKGGSLHPLLVSGLASPQLLEDRRRRRPDRRLQADNLRRRRRHHHQPSRHCRQQHLPPSDINASHRQQRSHHHRSSCDQQHRLQRSQGQSRRSTRQDNRNSTSMTKWKMNILYTRSTTSRTSMPQPTMSS